MRMLHYITREDVSAIYPQTHRAMLQLSPIYQRHILYATVQLALLIACLVVLLPTMTSDGTIFELQV